jgi:quinol monooxygenase YgiN
MPDHQDTPVVLINTFRVKAEDQAKLVALLTKITEDSVAMATGFDGATLHRSLDGERVVMYASWRSLSHYEAMRAGSASAGALKEIAQIATFEPGAFAVVREFRPSEL